VLAYKEKESVAALFLGTQVQSLLLTKAGVGENL